MRAPPQKLVYVGAEGPLGKNLEYLTKKYISLNSTKGDPLGRQGVESLRGKRRTVRPQPPPPKSATEDTIKNLRSR